MGEPFLLFGGAVLFFEVNLINIQFSILNLKYPTKSENWILGILNWIFYIKK